MMRLIPTNITKRRFLIFIKSALRCMWAFYKKRISKKKKREKEPKACKEYLKKNQCSIKLILN